MQKFSDRILWLAGGVILLACSFSVIFEPNSTAVPAAPASAIPATIWASVTHSPTRVPFTPTPTGWFFPIVPGGLDPNAVPKGKIAFEKGIYNEDGIFLVAASAETQNPLANLYPAAFDPVWSPDGSRIALDAYRFASNSEYPGDAQEAQKVESLVFVDEVTVLDSDGSNFKALTHLKVGDRLWEFDWSPDGRWIAVVHTFTEYGSGSFQYSEPAVFVVPTDGSGTMKKIGDTAGINSHIEWLPDSFRVAYLDPGGLLVIADIDTGEQTTVARLNAPADSHRVFDISPDGKILAYVEYSSSAYSLNVADLEEFRKGGDVRKIILFQDVLDNPGTYVPMVGDLSFSPDGSRLMFVHSERGIATLRLFSAGDGAPILLTRLTDCTLIEKTMGPQSNVECWAPNWKPAWSPDGQWIVYATATMGRGWENGEIYILNAAQAVAGSIQPVLQAEHGRNPHWQPVK
jgi:Tol biopolymer transport system component